MQRKQSKEKKVRFWNLPQKEKSDKRTKKILVLQKSLDSNKTIFATEKLHANYHEAKMPAKFLNVSFLSKLVCETFSFTSFSLN